MYKTEDEAGSKPKFAQMTGDENIFNP